MSSDMLGLVCSNMVRVSAGPEHIRGPIIFFWYEPRVMTCAILLPLRNLKGFVVRPQRPHETDVRFFTKGSARRHALRRTCSSPGTMDRGWLGRMIQCVGETF
jgi:hypothetical protein